MANPNPSPDTRFGGPKANPQGNGRPPGASVKAALLRILAAEIGKMPKPKTYAEEAARRIWDLSEAGDKKAQQQIQALLAIMERSDGKEATTIQAGAEGGGIEIHLHPPKGQERDGERDESGGE